MAQYTIPIATSEPQTFSVTLSAVQYRCTLRWITGVEGGWLLDIALAESETPLVAGISLVTGVDLLAQFPEAGVAGMLWLFSADELPPGYSDLGTAVQLIYETTEDEL